MSYLPSLNGSPAVHLILFPLGFAINPAPHTEQALTNLLSEPFRIHPMASLVFAGVFEYIAHYLLRKRICP